MAIEMRFYCGCTFGTAVPAEAAMHANATGHTLTAQGRVEPDLTDEDRQRIRADVERTMTPTGYRRLREAREADAT